MMKRLLTAFLVLFSLQVNAGPLVEGAYYVGSGGANYNPTPLTGIAEFSDVILQGGFNSFYELDLVDVKIEVRGDTTKYASVRGYLTGTTCTSALDNCTFTVEKIFGSSENDGGKFVMPDFDFSSAPTIDIFSSIPAGSYNYGAQGGCDGIVLAGQSNMRGLPATGDLDFSQGRMLTHSHTATTTAVESDGTTIGTVTVDNYVSGLDDPSPTVWQYTGGVDGSPRHPVGIFVEAVDGLEHYDVEPTDGSIGVRLGRYIDDYKRNPISSIGGERPTCLIPVADPGTGLCINNFFPNGDWGGPTQFGDPDGLGGTNYNNMESQILNFLRANGGNRIIGIGWIQGENDAIDQACTTVFKQNTLNMFADLRRRIPELINVPIVYTGYTPCFQAGTGCVENTYNTGIRGAAVQEVTECDLPLELPYSGYASLSGVINPPTNSVHWSLENYRGANADDGQISEAFFDRFVSLWDGTYDPLSNAEYIANCNPTNVVPGKAQNLTEVIKPGGADLSWGAPATGIPNTFEYHVRVATDNTMTTIIQGGTQCTPTVDCLTSPAYDTGTGLTNGTEYYYDVQAWNASGVDDGNPGGTGWGQRTSQGTTGEPFTPADPPGQVLNLVGTSNLDSQVPLDWDAPSPGPVQETITGYEIERSLANQNSWIAVGTTNAATTTFTDDASNIPNDAPENLTAYDYRVRATTTNNQETIADWTIVAGLTPSASAPATPPAPTVSTSTNGRGLSTSSWGAVASTPPVTDSDPAYQIQKTSDNGSTWLPVTPIDRTAAQGLTYADPDILDSTLTYRYRVRGQNGNDGDWGEGNNFDPTPAIPPTASISVASPVSGTIDVTWDEIAQGAAGEAQITQYEVFRRFNNGAYSSQGFVAFGCTPTCTYQDTVTPAVPPDDGYSYQVQGVSAAGDENADSLSADSGYSLGAGPGDPYATINGLTELLIHAQADVGMDCGSGVGNCSNGNTILEWDPPSGAPAGIGDLIQDPRTGFQDPGLTYVTGGWGSGAAPPANTDRVLLYRNSSASTVTTDFNTGYGKIVYVNTSANNFQTDNLFSNGNLGFGRGDTLWFTDASATSTVCAGNDDGLSDLCVPQSLPANDWIVTAFHNGASGASAIQQLIIYETTGASSTSGICAGHTAGTPTAPAVYCDATNGFYAAQVTGVNQDVNAAVKYWINAYSTDANAGFSCVGCIYKGVVATGFAGLPSAPGAGDGLLVDTVGGETLTDGSDLVKEVIKEMVQ